MQTVTSAAEARDRALEELQQRRSAVAALEQQQSDLTRHHDELRAQVGQRLLDDPTAGEQIRRELQQLRDQADIAELTLKAARPLVAPAEASYLAAEADLLERDVVAARRALEKHLARTAELVEDLRRHEGTASDRHRPVSPREGRLRQVVDLAELRVAILRDMAGGVDPTARVTAAQDPLFSTVHGVARAEAYPAAVWGRDAVVPAPEYSAAVEASRGELAELEELAEVLPAEVEEWATRQAQEQRFDPRIHLDGLTIRQHRLEALDEDRQRVERTLAELGHPRG